MRGRSMSLLEAALDIHERAKVAAAAFVNSIPDLEPQERRQLRSIAVNRAVGRLSGVTGALTTVADPTNPQHFSVYDDAHADETSEDIIVPPPRQSSQQQQRQAQEEQTFYFARPSDGSSYEGNDEDGMTLCPAVTNTSSSTFTQQDIDDEDEFDMVDMRGSFMQAQGVDYDHNNSLPPGSPTGGLSSNTTTAAARVPSSGTPVSSAPVASFALPVFNTSQEVVDSATPSDDAPPSVASRLLRRPSKILLLVDPAVDGSSGVVTQRDASQLIVTPKLVSILKKHIRSTAAASSSSHFCNMSMTSFSVTGSMMEDPLSPLTTTSAAVGAASATVTSPGVAAADASTSADIPKVQYLNSSTTALSEGASRRNVSFRME